jgi:hypothetical protein
LETPRKGRFHLAAVDLVAAALLVLSWLTGDHFLPWVSWHSEAPVFLATVLLAWRAVWRAWRTTRPRSLNVPIATVPFLLLLAVSIVQWMLGLQPFAGDVWVFFFYTCLCVVWLSLGYAVTSRQSAVEDETVPEELTLVAWTLVAGALLSTVLAFAQVFDVWDGAAWIVRMSELRRPGGNMAQPNHLATLQVMGVASIVYLRGLKRIGAVAFGTVMFTLCLGIAATESRSGALSVLVLFAWWACKRSAVPIDRAAGGPFAWVAAYCAMFVAWPYLLDVMHLLQYAAGPRVADVNPRLAVWPQLLEAAAMRPWLGWGFHQVAAAQNAVVSQGAATSEAYTYSHNLLLDLVLWFGAPIGLLFAAGGTLYAVRRMRAARRLLPWYVVGAMVPLAVHSMVEYPYAYAYLLVPPIFLIGALEGSMRSGHVRCRLAPVAVVLTLATLAIAWSAVEYVRIEEDFRVARMESRHIGTVPSEYQPPRPLMFDQLAVLLDDARLTPTSNMSPAGMRVLRSAALQYPWLATQYRYARALELNGDPAGAARQFEVIRAMWGEKAYERIKKSTSGMNDVSHPSSRDGHSP